MAQDNPAAITPQNTIWDQYSFGSPPTSVIWAVCAQMGCNLPILHSLMMGEKDPIDEASMEGIDADFNIDSNTCRCFVMEARMATRTIL